MSRIQLRQIEKLIGIGRTGQKIGLGDKSRVQQCFIVMPRVPGRKTVPDAERRLRQIFPQRRSLSLPDLRSCLLARLR